MFRRWLAPAGAELLSDADLIVPVPLYRSRLWTRRFNQSALLAPHGKPSRPLPATAAAQRCGRLQSEPEADANVQDKRVVIIDDVIRPARQPGLRKSAAMTEGLSL